MKIVQVIPKFALGGAETMCENLMYALKDLGHKVVAVSLYTEHTYITERLEKKGFSIIYLEKKFGLDFSMIRKLIKVFNQEKPDAIHTHLDSLKYVVIAAKLSNTKCRIIQTVHNVAEKEASGIVYKINKFFYKKSWAIPVALSNEIQKSISEYYGLEFSSIPCVFNGIDLSKCLPKNEYSLEDTIKITHVGRFAEQKNHRGLIDIFSNVLTVFPNCVLQLVGDGELREEIELYVKNKNISDKVIFLGMQSNVYPILHDSDLFVLPSVYEGFPMTLIEAMATGLPIVATAVGGVPDMLNNGYSAAILPCDVKLLSDASIELLQNQHMRNVYGNRVLKKSCLYSSKSMAEKYCSIYL